ncbi:hypothetical protein SAMD00019534_063660 [Acytostelium subglobosum LB1]|uniref:hypothetical protein n=1 Tax=Acytostelium subglobosum LB1 TaxID=1410327 RepID=UPI000644EDC9|nr:hypothetical protein SAMD00019534_063660 [Acytostelium subglobosum LB1]GAM23191.1 hypothetical protein SAMD00019534_063660 [Acytostelium subglobosum LB1]|eukprot:XP_012753640.1 hypothetical protein SAMD00019534_063660 [Acytostelium subglobosum LB1]
MSSASTGKLTSHFENEIQKQVVPPPGKKERVWTPHSDDQYQRQTVVKATGKPAGPPPPKKSISDLP